MRTRRLPGAGIGCTLVLPLIAALGCQGGNDGEFGNGDFVYNCSSLADAACADDMTPDMVPDQIAVGGRFELTFRPNGGVPGGTVAPSTFVRGEGESFVPLEPGIAAMLAWSDDRILDVLHLTFVEPTIEIDATRLNAGGDVVLAVGETWTVRARPETPGGQPLAGSLEYRWETSDSSVLPLTNSGDAEATFEPATIGEADVTAVSGSLEATIHVIVEPRRVPNTTGTTGVTGSSGGSGGSGSGTGGSTGSSGGTDGSSTGGAT